MPKEDIFSKINLKDYNIILENILEQKAFSEDVKNLLLSMLYRIENGYQDYKMVKVNVSSQGYFLKKIVQIIKEKCIEIELIKPLSERSKILEKNKTNFIVDKEKGKIICYPNERIIFEALITLSQEEIEIGEEYKLYKKGIEEILLNGNLMSLTEVIRDFNGWSWDVTTSQMQSKNINIIYQILTILLGKSFLQNWITGDDKEEIEETQIPNNEILRSKYNNSFGMTKEEVQENIQIDYIELMKEKLKENFGEELTEKFWDCLKKVVIAIGYNRSEKQKQIIIEEKEEIEKKLKRMQDNKKYLEDLSKTKTEILKQIKNIDKILADEKILKQEYTERNSKLPNKEKIFSVSHLKIMLEKEREAKLDQIKQCNKQMEPNEFVKLKKELEEKSKFFEDIRLEEKADERTQINKLQLQFLDCFMEKIKKTENKANIRNLIYELRYYEQIPYMNSKIYEFQEVQEKLKKIETELINKSCKEKILTRITNEEQLNTRILSNQFKSKMINLENMVYILRYHKGILRIEIYDTNVEDEVKEIKITEKTELQVKLNRKIKLWE